MSNSIPSKLIADIAIASASIDSKPDSALTPEQLDDRYNPDGDGEHPDQSIAAWCDAVQHQRTLLGYWEWVSHQFKEPNS